jgi:hypothetical protein
MGKTHWLLLCMQSTQGAYENQEENKPVKDIGRHTTQRPHPRPLPKEGRGEGDDSGRKVIFFINHPVIVKKI